MVPLPVSKGGEDFKKIKISITVFYPLQLAEGMCDVNQLGSAGWAV